MLSSLSRASRLALVLALGAGYVAYDGLGRTAFAQGDEEGDEEEEGGEEEVTEDEENPEDDKDQPPLTAGGLYTMNTYPQREISRPLTMTEKITQLRFGIGTDLSAKGAFESAGFSLEGVHGLKDNFSLIGGFTSAYNLKQYGVYVGFEGALAYDLINFRMAANLHRNAIPLYGIFCNPPQTPNEMPMGGTCMRPDAAQEALPSGDFNAGGTKFSVDIGFPFRYAIRPEIAIIALQTLISIDFNSVKEDYVTVSDDDDDPMTPPTFLTKGNGAKPDLNPSIGIATNPIAPVSLIIFAQLRIPDFDTSAGAFQIPVTGRVQFSPNQKFDIGLEFILLNVKPPEGQSPIDNRYLSLFAQTRFGK